MASKSLVLQWSNSIALGHRQGGSSLSLTTTWRLDNRDGILGRNKSLIQKSVSFPLDILPLLHCVSKTFATFSYWTFFCRHSVSFPLSVVVTSSSHVLKVGQMPLERHTLWFANLLSQVLLELHRLNYTRFQYESETRSWNQSCSWSNRRHMSWERTFTPCLPPFSFFLPVFLLFFQMLFREKFSWVTCRPQQLIHTTTSELEWRWTRKTFLPVPSQSRKLQSFLRNPFPPRIPSIVHIIIILVQMRVDH